MIIADKHLYRVSIVGAFSQKKAQIGAFFGHTVSGRPEALYI